MATKKIQSALISVYNKDNLAPIVAELHQLGITIYSTGGTQKFIETLDIPVTAVEEITAYPSILSGRVKTLHPKVFGGILARREAAHQVQLEDYEIPEIDLVIVDLYPFEETLAQTDNEEEIIEKIDIGGISLIRAAAKNYKDVLVIPSRKDYTFLLNLLRKHGGESTLALRKETAHRAFQISAHYDRAIANYFNDEATAFYYTAQPAKTLRYGENPHQTGTFYGDLDALFDKLHGKALSFNNLVDIDAAIHLMYEFRNSAPTFAILKHTNACGVATRPNLLGAWEAALAGDPISAFGGILIANTEIDAATAEAIHSLFFEVIIAPAFHDEALAILQKRKKRIILRQKAFQPAPKLFKRLLNGVIEQDADLQTETASALTLATKRTPTEQEIQDLLFGNICAKHLKSNTIALVKSQQLVGMGCGQTSRVDALRQAIHKAQSFGFDLNGAIMASDAFFPFNDCVDLAQQAGITAVIQPGGSIRDQDSIDKCDEHQVAMVLTGVRHFKH